MRNFNCVRRGECSARRSAPTGAEQGWLGPGHGGRRASSRSPKWVEGNITHKTGPVSYKVRVSNDLQWRRHQDQIVPLKQKKKGCLYLNPI